MKKSLLSVLAVSLFACAPENNEAALLDAATVAGGVALRVKHGATEALFKKGEGKVLQSLVSYDDGAAGRDHGLCYVGDRNQVCSLLSQLSKASKKQYEDGDHELATLKTCFLQGAGDKPVIARTEHRHDWEAKTVSAEWTIRACGDGTSNELAAVADGFKAIIKEELYISEADYPWTPAYFTAPVDAALSEASVRGALGVPAATPIHIADDEWMADFWSYYADATNHEPSTVQAYAALKAAMSAQLQTVRLIKVGVEDSGKLELYLLGRTQGGQLVGLKTFAVET